MLKTAVKFDRLSPFALRVRQSRRSLSKSEPVAHIVKCSVEAGRAANHPSSGLNVE